MFSRQARLLVLAVLTFAAWQLVGAARAYGSDVKIRNLGDDSLWYCEAWYYPGGPNAFDGTIDAEQWNVKGWYEIKPGTVAAIPEEHYIRVEHDGKAVTWKKASKAVGSFAAHPTEPFEVVVDLKNTDRVVSVGEGPKKGHKAFDFYQYPAQTMKTGTAWKVKDVTYQFDFETQSKSSLKTQVFPAPEGKVLDYEFSLTSNRGDDPKWFMSDKQVELRVVLSGGGTGVFDSKTRATYRGSVTVYYIVR